MPVQKKGKGFTLVELLVVIAIISILAVIGFTTFSGIQKSVRDAKRKSDINTVAKALELFKSQNGYYMYNGSGTWSANFNNSEWGAFGTQPLSVKNVLGSYFSGSVPQDPKCSNFTCDNGFSDYGLNIFPGGNTFHLFASLENGNGNNSDGCNTPASGSSAIYFCMKNQQ